MGRALGGGHAAFLWLLARDGPRSTFSINDHLPRLHPAMGATPSMASTAHQYKQSVRNTKHHVERTRASRATASRWGPSPMNKNPILGSSRSPIYRLEDRPKLMGASHISRVTEHEVIR
jgi:hypothetical protein